VPAAPAAPCSEGPLLADYREHHTDVSVHFECDLVPGKLAAAAAGAGGLPGKFKLASRISTGAHARGRGVRARARGASPPMRARRQARPASHARTAPRPCHARAPHTARQHDAV
jgi:hypothetical protein